MVKFDPTTRAFLQDPYPVYEQLRRQGSILWWDDGESYLVVSHSDCAALLDDGRLNSSDTVSRLADFPHWVRVQGHSFIFQDGEQHRGARQVARRALGRPALDRLARLSTDIASELVSGLAGQPTFEVMSQLANPLVARLTCALVGFPAADQRLITRWVSLLLRPLDLFVDFDAFDAADRAAREFGAYVQAQLDAPGTIAAGSLLDLLRVEMGRRPHQWSVERAVATAVLLAVGGFAATPHLIGNVALQLAVRPELCDELRVDPARLKLAIEEFVRFDSPLQIIIARTTTGAIETRERRIESGSTVTFLIGAANRDPAVFDRPDELRLDRRPNPHLGFGAGPHRCVAGLLGRIGTEAVIRALLTTYSRLRLATGEVEYEPLATTRGPEKLVLEGTVG